MLHYFTQTVIHFREWKCYYYTDQYPSQSLPVECLWTCLFPTYSSPGIILSKPEVKFVKKFKCFQIWNNVWKASVLIQSDFRLIIFGFHRWFRRYSGTIMNPSNVFRRFWFGVVWMSMNQKKFQIEIFLTYLWFRTKVKISSDRGWLSGDVSGYKQSLTRRSQPEDGKILFKIHFNLWIKFTDIWKKNLNVKLFFRCCRNFCLFIVMYIKIPGWDSSPLTTFQSFFASPSLFLKNMNW